MEEAGQDVPAWLRGEADRFKNHQVQDSFDLGVFYLIKLFVLFTFATLVPMSLFEGGFVPRYLSSHPSLRRDRGRKAEEEM